MCGSVPVRQEKSPVLRFAVDNAARDVALCGIRGTPGRGWEQVNGSNTTVTDDQPDEAPDAEIAYAFKPSLLGAPWSFRLWADGLQWNAGRHTGRISYAAITRVRLSFKPVSLQTYRFVAEVWSPNAPKLLIASASWRSPVEQERQDDAYTTFVTELHRRMLAAGTEASFETGVPPAIYWPGLVMFVGVSLALAALTARAMQAGEWAGAAFIAGFLLLFLWQVGTYFRRNRPGTYRPDALPPDLVPRA